MQSLRLHLRPTGLVGIFFVAEPSLSGINRATQLSWVCFLWGGRKGEEEGERETDALLHFIYVFVSFFFVCRDWMMLQLTELPGQGPTQLPFDWYLEYVFLFFSSQST